jgi:hypothetical protein
VPSDLRAVVRAALDVEARGAPFDEILLRARGRRIEGRRRARSILAAGTLVVFAALFAGAHTGVADASVHVAAAPAPAPVPLST